MAKKMSGLGRGIDAIFLENTVESEEKRGGVMTLRVSQLEPKGNQPRRYFDTEALSQLAESISVHGVLQPILVRELGGERYQIIAGERRFRAAKMAGVAQVPVILLEKTDAEVAEIAIIENIQREDLNPIEEAAAYRALAEEYNLTQEDISHRVGKSRSAIANALRLLDLPDAIRAHVISGELSAGHARALLGLRSMEDMETLCKFILDKGLSVRMTEDAVRKCNRAKTTAEEPEAEDKEPEIVDYAKDLEGRVMAALGRRVRLDEKRGKKCISFFYEDNGDLEEFLRPILGDAFFDSAY